MCSVLQMFNQFKLHIKMNLKALFVSWFYLKRRINVSSKVSSLRDIESGVNEFKCSDRVHDLLGLLRVGHQATTLRGAGHQSLLFLNFPCRVAGGCNGHFQKQFSISLFTI